MIMKYMGSIVTSHSMKNRNKSNAVKTTIMAPSTSSTKLMNALTLVSIDRHETRTQSGVSSAVNKTSKTLMPSTPTKYWMPSVGIQSMRSMNCMPSRAGSNFDHSKSAKPRPTSELASAIRRTH